MLFQHHLPWSHPDCSVVVCACVADWLSMSVCLCVLLYLSLYLYLSFSLFLSISICPSLSLASLSLSLSLSSHTVLLLYQIRERYLGLRSNILSTAPSNPAEDFSTQMSKLADGVLTDKYVPSGDSGYANSPFPLHCWSNLSNRHSEWVCAIVVLFIMISVCICILTSDVNGSQDWGHTTHVHACTHISIPKNTLSHAHKLTYIRPHKHRLNARTLIHVRKHTLWQSLIQSHTHNH